jgi:outer membrane protein
MMQAKGERREARGFRRGRLAAAGPVVLTVLAATAQAALAETVRLDADGAAARAVQASNVVAAAAERSEAARQTIAASDASRYPTVSAGVSLSQRSSVPEFVAPINGPLQPPVVIYPNIETAYATSLQAVEVLYAGGSVAAGRAASRHQLDGQEAARDQVVADVGLAGRLAYWEAVRAVASMEAAVANEQRTKRLLDDTRALREAGMAVDADVLAAQSRLASAHVAVIRVQTRRLDAFARLRSLLHLASGDDVVLADRLTPALPPAPPALADATADAIAHRPELAAITAQLGAVTAAEQIALAPSKPTVAATAEWDMARPNLRYFPLTDSWNDSWSVGVSAGWKLFDGGKARADARASQASRRAIEAQRAEAERQIALEVEVTRQDLLAALATAVASDAAVDAAVERERASRERIAAGLAPMVEILDAQAELAAAEQQQVDTRASAWISAARLGRAIGR